MISFLAGRRGRCVVACLIGIFVLPGTGQAAVEPGQVAYTQASTSNLRAAGSADAEILQKLPINTAVTILERRSDWVSVRLSSNNADQGWLHQSLLAERPLSLDEAMTRYGTSPIADPARLRWIERAAAIAPQNIDILDELVKTLQSLREYERSGRLLDYVAGLKADRAEFRHGPTVSEGIAEEGAALSSFLMETRPSGRIRGNFALGALEDIVGIPVFLSGPHQNGRFDFRSVDSFGHYNPAFIRLVIDGLLSEPPDNPLYLALAKQLTKFPGYGERLASLGSALCAIRYQPDRFAEFKLAYLERIRSGQKFSAFYIPGIREFNGSFQHIGYDPADVAFWARRDWDGTFELVKLALAKTLYRLRYERFVAISACFQPGADPAPRNEYFVADSFVDHETWGDWSALSCREELIARHDWREGNSIRTGIANGEKVAVDTRIDVGEQIVSAMANTSCPAALIAGPHYAFVATENGYRWQPVALDFSLAYLQTFHGCSPQRLVALTFEGSLRSGQAMLFRMTPPEKSVGYAISTTERLGSEPNVIELDFERAPGLARLYKKLDTKMWTDEEAAGVEPREVIAGIELWAEFDNGNKALLMRRRGIGKYSYSSAEVSEVKILDANGDNDPDFIFDIDNGGKYLVLTSNGEILRAVELVTDQYSGIGGC